jgi:PDZ domain-containing protein
MTLPVFDPSDLLRLMRTKAPNDNRHTRSARTVTPGTDAAKEVDMNAGMNDDNGITMNTSVPLPPPGLQIATDSENPYGANNRERRRLWWALPLLTVAWLSLGSVIAASLISLRLWELAPGSVEQVANRLSFDKNALSQVTRYPAESSVMFVTALGGQLTALDALVGALDSDVDVQTYKERFGESTPGVQQQVGFQSMTSAKQIAEYVAYTRLGLDASLTLGAIVVNELVCLETPVALSACKQLEVGDTLTALNGESIATLDELMPLMKGKKEGEIVTLTITPHKTTTSVERRVQLIVSPEDPNRVIVGFIPADTRTVDLPFEVGIDTDQIGGPSAGLAFTLALLDELTPGDLMGGKLVVATGTINEDESVGAIGALRQKAVAVKAIGADVFIIPASQSDEEIASARRAAGPKVTVIPVNNLEEALVALEALGGSGLTNAAISL